MLLKRFVAPVADESAADRLSRSLGIEKLPARVLAARGYTDEKSAGEFFSDECEFESPLEIKDMDAAAKRINEAVENDETVAVFGDYDVDGVTATALMYKYLQGCGAKVICSLPTRESSGYGLTNSAVDLLKRHGASLIITVDNGVSAAKEIAHAKTLGIDVVVCDHHLPPETLPEAAAVVDPLRDGDGSTFKGLAGVGVALKLAAATENCGADELLELYGDLAAVGTVSDIMPLKGENRAIVKRGLVQLRESENEGLRALCAEADIAIESIEASTIAFGIAPRINAAGRMGNAALALKLMLTEDPDEAAAIAKKLCAMNRERQATEQEIVKLVEMRIADDPYILKRPIIVVSGENLHAGVIGIVCSRLVERYGKPAIVISIEGDSAKGSGRSVRGFSLHRAVSACGGLLEKFGGHDMAAGFTLDAKNVESFKQALFDYCAGPDAAMACPELGVDAYVELGDITEAAVEQLERFAPFGCQNEEPVFAVKNAEFVSASPLSEKHTRVTLRQNGSQITGALFSVLPSELPYKAGDRLDAAFTPSIYDAGGKRCVSTKFRSLRSAAATEEDFSSLDAYAGLCRGAALTQELKNLIAPSRDDVAYIYRKLKNKSINRDDTAAVKYEFSELPAGKALCALDTLEELGLARTSASRGGRTVAAAKAPQKRELSESMTFSRLNGD